VEVWNFLHHSRNPATGGVGGLFAIAAITIAIASAVSYTFSVLSMRFSFALFRFATAIN
jgi:hypothetical protein